MLCMHKCSVRQRHTHQHRTIDSSQTKQRGKLHRGTATSAGASGQKRHQSVLRPRRWTRQFSAGSCTPEQPRHRAEDRRLSPQLQLLRAPGQPRSWAVTRAAGTSRSSSFGQGTCTQQAGRTPGGMGSWRGQPMEAPVRREVPAPKYLQGGRT